LGIAWVAFADCFVGAGNDDAPLDTRRTRLEFIPRRCFDPAAKDVPIPAPDFVKYCPEVEPINAEQSIRMSSQTLVARAKL
jgi:hypothetical protein